MEVQHILCYYLMETIRSRRNLVKADFEIALNLAKQLDFLFEKGTFAEKRLLCETVLKRLYIEDGKIMKTELNPPFALITSVGGGSESFQFGSRGWIRTAILLIPSSPSPACLIYSSPPSSPLTPAWSCLWL